MERTTKLWNKGSKPMCDRNCHTIPLVSLVWISIVPVEKVHIGTKIEWLAGSYQARRLITTT